MASAYEYSETALCRYSKRDIECYYVKWMTGIGKEDKALCIICKLDRIAWLLAKR